MSAAQRQALLRWYARHARDLPWRRTRDPYRILVSEIMLQQTQVDRVIPFYERFLDRFPDERSLAAAPFVELHRLWQGLGYPSRADRLQQTCRIVVEERQGCWPDTVEALLTLPGLGPYTAAAVACFAFGRAVPLVDTNVARVYSRRDGLPAEDRKALWQHAAAELARRSPLRYNNALMELGALICSARAPRCERCPWRASCVSQGVEAPLVKKVAAARPRYRPGGDRSAQRIVLALVHDQGRYLVARRPQAAPCGGKWELPGGKQEAAESERQALARELREECGLELLAARPFAGFEHAYDDRALRFAVFRCRVYDAAVARPLASQELRWVSPEEFLALDFPPANQALLERFRSYHRR
jgi:A/G-specific adenine glycosylase